MWHKVGCQKAGWFASFDFKVGGICAPGPLREQGLSEIMRTHWICIGDA